MSTPRRTSGPVAPIVAVSAGVVALAGIVYLAIRRPEPATQQPAPCAQWAGDHTAAMRAKDYACVRVMLLPKLKAGSIGVVEARYLNAACAAVGDSACQKAAAEAVP